jgi:hypothetical protein
LQGSLGAGDWNRALSGTGNASGTAAAAIVDLGLLHGAAKLGSIAGVVLDEIDGDVKVNQESQVLGSQNVTQEGRPDFLFHGQHPGLAATGVDEQSEGERLVGVGREVLDGLGLTVLVDQEVLFFQIRNQPPALILDVEVEVDYLDVDFQGGDGLALLDGGFILESGAIGNRVIIIVGRIRGLLRFFGRTLRLSGGPRHQTQCNDRDGGYSELP